MPHTQSSGLRPGLLSTVCHPQATARHLLGGSDSCLGTLQLVQLGQGGSKGASCKLELGVVPQQLLVQCHSTCFHQTQTAKCPCHLLSIGPARRSLKLDPIDCALQEAHLQGRALGKGNSALALACSLQEYCCPLSTDPGAAVLHLVSWNISLENSTVSPL